MHLCRFICYTGFTEFEVAFVLNMFNKRNVRLYNRHWACLKPSNDSSVVTSTRSTVEKSLHIVTIAPSQRLVRGQDRSVHETELELTELLIPLIKLITSKYACTCISVHVRPRKKKLVRVLFSEILWSQGVFLFLFFILKWKF